MCIHKINIAECTPPKENDPNYDDFFVILPSSTLSRVQQHREREKGCLFSRFLLWRCSIVGHGQSYHKKTIDALVQENRQPVSEREKVMMVTVVACSNEP